MFGKPQWLVTLFPRRLRLIIKGSSDVTCLALDQLALRGYLAGPGGAFGSTGWLDRLAQPVGSTGWLEISHTKE